MKIIIIQPFADGAGRSWVKGRRYTVDNKTGAGFIKAGFARAAYTDLVAELAEAGAGLVVTSDTDKALAAEAKKAKLTIHRPRDKKAADTDGEEKPADAREK